MCYRNFGEDHLLVGLMGDVNIDLDQSVLISFSLVSGHNILQLCLCSARYSWIAVLLATF